MSPGFRPSACRLSSWRFYNTMSLLILQALFCKLTQHLCFAQIQPLRIVQFVQRAGRRYGKPSDYAACVSWPRVSCLFCRACVRFNARYTIAGIFSRLLLTFIKTALFLAVWLVCISAVLFFSFSGRNTMMAAAAVVVVFLVLLFFESALFVACSFRRRSDHIFHIKLLAM